MTIHVTDLRIRAVKCPGMFDDNLVRTRAILANSFKYGRVYGELIDHPRHKSMYQLNQDRICLQVTDLRVISQNEMIVSWVPTGPFMQDVVDLLDFQYQLIPRMATVEDRTSFYAIDLKLLPAAASRKRFKDEQ